jgi:hypothetical protein
VSNSSQGVKRPIRILAEEIQKTSYIIKEEHLSINDKPYKTPKFYNKKLNYEIWHRVYTLGSWDRAKCYCKKFTAY